MSLTISELEKLQAEHPDWRMELIEGNILVRSPSDYQSSEIATEFAIQLCNWVKPRKLGRVAGANAGFILSSLEAEETTENGNEPKNLRITDVSFVRAVRLKKTQRDFVQLVPDLIVEVKSKTDRIKPLEEKIQLFLQLGSTVGILIDPDKLTVTVYRLNQEPVVLQSGDILTLSELLPGWELAISDLWPLEFE